LQSRRQNEYYSKPSTIEERRTRLEMIWSDLAQKPVARSVQNFRKRLQACVFKAGGQTFNVTDFYVNLPSNQFP